MDCPPLFPQNCKNWPEYMASCTVLCCTVPIDINTMFQQVHIEVEKSVYVYPQKLNRTKKLELSDFNFFFVSIVLLTENVY